VHYSAKISAPAKLRDERAHRVCVRHFFNKKTKCYTCELLEIWSTLTHTMVRWKHPANENIQIHQKQTVLKHEKWFRNVRQARLYSIDNKFTPVLQSSIEWCLWVFWTQQQWQQQLEHYLSEKPEGFFVYYGEQRARATAVNLDKANSNTVIN